MTLQTERRARLQLSATLVGSITVAVLAIFFVGEVGSGDISGLAHTVQLAPLVALLLLGWWRPGVAGALLLAAGSSLAGAYFIETGDSSVARSEQLLVAALFLFPPILAGALFLAARTSSQSSSLIGVPRTD